MGILTNSQLCHRRKTLVSVSKYKAEYWIPPDFLHYLLWFLFVRWASLRVNYSLLSRYSAAHTKQNTPSWDTPADVFSMRMEAPIQNSNLKTNRVSPLKMSFDVYTNCLIIKLSKSPIQSLNHSRL